MSISIRKRLIPFSHKPGTQCLLPGTGEVITASPDQIKIGTLILPLEDDPYTLPFLLQQDLERDCVWVQTRTKRIKIRAIPEGVKILSTDRSTSKKEEALFAKKFSFSLPERVERLSLGCHKALDWDLVMHKMDFQTILPVLYRLCQKVPSTFAESSTETSFEHFYRSTFKEMNVSTDQPMFAKAFHTIRGFFFREESNLIHLLPNNPFPQGRFLGILTQFGRLDIEWTQKKLKKVILHVEKTQELTFQFSQKIRSFRCQGRTYLAQNSLKIEAGQTLFLDRFYESSHS